MPTTTPNPREGYRPNWVRMPPTYRGQSYSSRYGAQRAYNNSSRQTFNADRSREAAKTAYEQATNKSYEGVRTPASASAGAKTATAAAGATGIPATATAGATGLPVVATVAAVVAIVGTIVLDPFNKDPFLKLADENAILQNLMPPDPPQKIEEGKFPFTGGQAKVMYRVYRQRGWERNSSIYGDGTWSKYSDSVYYTDVMGPVRGTKIKVESDNLYHFYLLANNLSIDVAVLEVSSSIKNPWFEIINCQRLDGQPDTSGNPPPTVQPIYTTNITNNYTIVPSPIVGESTPAAPSAPPIIILPIGGSSSPSVASAPPPQIIIPELQPDIPILISPLPPSNQQTSPDTATSPPPPSYPSVTKSPSTGITAEEAEKSKYNNTQVTPSTGVKAESKTAVTPEVAPISESATRPTVKDSDRTLTFSSSAQSASSQSETLANSQTSVNKLLEIEQALTRLRISISSLQPSDSATSLSNDIQRLERDTASLRERAPTISSETIATELQRIRNRLRGTQARIINLNPSAQSHLADLQRQQIEQQIDREITRLRSPSTTPGQQTETETQTPSQTNTETQTTLERLQEQLTNLGLGIALLTPLVNLIQSTANNTTPDALRNAAASGVCSTLKPGGCMSGVANNAQTAANNSTTNQGLLNQILNILRGANEILLPFIWQRVQIIDTKLGAQMPGGLGGAVGRLSRSLGIDRVFNLINFMANLHNASMLSASLKVTLLEMLSSVGNATGLLQTSEGDNVDLNNVFNQGIEKFITSLIGVDAWASMKLTWRKYSSIYRAATNSLNAVSSMFNSIGNAVETTAEHTGKIGNAIRAAGLVRENAYNFMAEKLNVKTSRFMTFESKVVNVTQVLETVNEIAENIVEGQQQYTEAVKATADFQKQLADAQKNPGIDNKALKEEADKIKANLVKDPTGEDETGLLSFLTDL